MAAHSGIKHEKPYPKRVRPPLIDIFGTVMLVGLALVPLIALLLPMAVIVIVSFDSGPILRFPPEVFSFERYAGILELDGFLDSVRLSLIVASIVVIIDLLLHGMLENNKNLMLEKHMTMKIIQIQLNLALLKVKNMK